MDIFEVKQRQRDLILQENQIGALFRRELRGLKRGQACTEFPVEPVLPVQSLGAHIVQHVVQLLVLIFVQPNTRRLGRRERECRINKLFGKGGENGGGFSSAGGKQ